MSLSEEWTRATADRTVEERVYEVATTLTEPTSVADVAARADCTKEGARSQLTWFVELGILERVAENPALYERNEEYFRFRRLTELGRRYDDANALDDALEIYRRADAELTAEFDEPGPDLVNPPQGSELVDLRHGEIDPAVVAHLRGFVNDPLGRPPERRAHRNLQ